MKRLTTTDGIKKERSQKEPTASLKLGEFSQYSRDRCVSSAHCFSPVPSNEARRRTCVDTVIGEHAGSRSTECS